MGFSEVDRALHKPPAISTVARYWGGAKQRISRLLGPQQAIPTSVLVIGPSSVGKSTLVASSTLTDLGLHRPKVIYGTDLIKTEVPARSIIHYNMLHQAEYAKGDWDAAKANWDFMAEPIFNKIVSSGLVQHAVVLVAPIAEIIERMNQRAIVEDVIPRRYNRELWLEAMQQLDLSALYEQLFNSLDQAGISYLVLFSSCRAHQNFLLSTRADTKANLDGVYGNDPSIASTPSNPKI